MSKEFKQDLKQPRIKDISEKLSKLINSVRNPLEKAIKKGLGAFLISPNPLICLVAGARFELATFGL